MPHALLPSRHRPSLRRPAAVLAATALALSLTSCGGDDDGAGGGNGGAADTPAEAIEAYLAAAAEGDFETAFSYVLEPGQFTAEETVRLSADIDPTITVISGGDEPSEGSGEEASVNYFWGDAEHTVRTVKSDDGWVLVEPAHLVETDFAVNEYELWLNEMPHLSAIADVTVLNAAGDDLTQPPTAFLRDPMVAAAYGATVEVHLKGKYGVPDQVIPVDIEDQNGAVHASFPIGEGSDHPDLDLGELGPQAEALILENMGLRSMYLDTDTWKYVFQMQPATDVSCQPWVPSSDYENFEGFYVQCLIDFADETVDGGPVMDNEGDRTVSPPGKDSSCAVYEPVPARYSLTTTSALTVEVLDGQARVMWEAEPGAPEGSLRGPTVYEASDYLDAECLDDPLDKDLVEAGEFYGFGPMPLGNPEKGTTVTLDLSTS